MSRVLFSQELFLNNKSQCENYLNLIEVRISFDFSNLPFKMYFSVAGLFYLLNDMEKFHSFIRNFARKL